MIQVLGVGSLILFGISCIFLLYAQRNWNYRNLKYPYRGTKDKFQGILANIILLLSSIPIIILSLIGIYIPEYPGTVIFLPAMNVGWYSGVYYYLSRKNFYLWTTPEGFSWSNTWGKKYQATYRNIHKYRYYAREGDLTWMILKTQHGTLRFDPKLTNAGLLIPQHAFRLTTGYWAQHDHSDDQDKIQCFYDDPEETQDLVMSYSGLTFKSEERI